MSALRLFIAIDFSEATIQKVVGLQKQLRAKLAACPIRWVAPENLHLTLQFLGETDQVKFPMISRTMDEIVSGFDPFEVHLKGIGCFPSLKKPEVIWLGLDHNKTLVTLAQSFAQRLEPMGFSPNGRFSPHLTLGRVNHFVEENQKQMISDLMMSAHSVEIGSDGIQEIILFRSTLTQTGPIYTALHRSKLKNMLH
ncbi:MAG: RNA 2',3'-cyclic phosphodiesterase [Anaerolineaceae bacterium]